MIENFQTSGFERNTSFGRNTITFLVSIQYLGIYVYV